MSVKRTNGFPNNHWETPDERMTDLCSKVRNESDGSGGQKIMSDGLIEMIFVLYATGGN